MVWIFFASSSLISMSNSLSRSKRILMLSIESMPSSSKVLSGLTFSRGIRWVVAITRRTRAWIVSDIRAFVEPQVLSRRHAFGARELTVSVTLNRQPSTGNSLSLNANFSNFATRGKFQSRLGDGETPGGAPGVMQSGDDRQRSRGIEGHSAQHDQWCGSIDLAE